MRRAAKVDNNHAEIVAALRKAGCVVTSLATVGHGVADLLVSHAGTWRVLEVKDRTGKLTLDQISWIARQRAEVSVVRNVNEALAAVRIG